MNPEDCLVSIVIPMRNEERYIRSCLQSILANDVPRDSYEIIVVDGDSTDRSRELVEQMQKEYPQIKLLGNKARTVPPAMNIGIRAARGKYILRMDGHSEYPRDYIRNCIEELERTGADNVGGRLITKPGSDSLVAKAIAHLTQNSIAVGNSKYRTGATGRYVDTVPFGAFRREVFDRVGLFREDLTRHQDFEFNARLRHAGGKIFLSPRIYLTYYNVPSFAKFMRQAYLNGVWCARAWTRYPVCFCLRHAAPLVFVAGLLSALVLGAVAKTFLWLALFGLAVYLAAASVAALQIASNNGLRYLFITPPLMFSYHLVYGASTIAGFFGVAAERLRVLKRPAAESVAGSQTDSA
jgi:glycosyltransferase involved in cell wall biosynthesis